MQIFELEWLKLLTQTRNQQKRMSLKELTQKFEARICKQPNVNNFINQNDNCP